MSTAITLPPADAPVEPVLRKGSLLGAELRRLRSRRLVRLFLLLGLVVFLGASVVAATQFAKPSAAVTARAEQARQAQFDQQKVFRAQCLAQPDNPGDGYCGPELTSLDEVGSIDGYIDKSPFRLQGEGRDGLVAIAAGAAGLAFLLGATYVGAEWSTRSMVALLFWEPRRRKVMLTKLAVLAGVSAALGALATGAWLVVARVLAATRGTTQVPNGTWGELYGSAGRGVLFVVLIGLLGFGIANLLRNTAASFGLAFVYFVIVENVLRGVLPGTRPWLLTENALALLQEGGTTIYNNDGFVDDRGFYQQGGQAVVDNLHGGLVIAAVVAVVVTLGVVLFTRRDLD